VAVASSRSKLRGRWKLVVLHPRDSKRDLRSAIKASSSSRIQIEGLDSTALRFLALFASS